MATIHITAAEAARNFAALLAQVRAGAEVVIEDDASPAVILRSLAPVPRRLLSECIALADAHAAQSDYVPVMDAEFAADMEDILNQRKPRETSTWD